MMAKRLARSALLLILVAGCSDKSNPASVAPTNTATLTLAVLSAAADLPTASGAILYRVSFQVSETSGRASAAINSVTFNWSTGHTSTLTLTNPVRVAASSTYSSGSVTSNDPEALTAGASTISVVVGFTDDSGRTGSVSGSAAIARASPPPTFTVAGVVTDGSSRAPIGGMSVTVFGGTYGGRTSSTDGNGYYSIGGVTGALTLSFAKPGYDLTTRNVSVNGDTRFDAAINPTAPPWSRSGVGNTVFDMPRTVSRVRITGTYRASGSNFIVYVGGRLVVNEIIGVSRTGGPTYTGIHLVTGGVVEIVNSRDVEWSFAQVQ